MLTWAKIFTQSKLKVFHKNLIHQRISERDCLYTLFLLIYVDFTFFADVSK